MKVRIIYSETGTGETQSVDADIKMLSGALVARAIWANEEDRPALSVACFTVLGDKAAFVLTSHDDYFGPTLWTGFVYTNFIEETGN